ncbi:MAG: MBL fold metallo-hydrolase [Acidobacteria bacterium]|nr:MBL fold metallo-hydrolase [Acidobacteriota bacterium]
MFQLCVLGSGSGGNCIVLNTGRTCLLIDVGFGWRTLKRRLKASGIQLPQVDAALITHGHSDHVSGIHSIVKDQNPVIFLNEGTREEVAELQELPRGELFSSRPFTIGDIEVQPFPVSHDSLDPVGFRLTTQGITGAVATDLGEIDLVSERRLQGCDWLVIESNHDLELLKAGSYPWFLKQRLLSNNGHLSNCSLSKFLAGAFDGRADHLFLAHLSRTNNHPEIAVEFATRALQSRPSPSNTCVHLTDQDKPSIVLEL